MKRNQRTPTHRPPSTKLSTLTNAALSDITAASRRLSALSLENFGGHSQSLLQQLHDCVNSLKAGAQTGSAPLSALSAQLEKLSVLLTTHRLESGTLSRALASNTSACETLVVELKNSRQSWDAMQRREQELQDSNQRLIERNRQVEEQVKILALEYRRYAQRHEAMEGQYRRFASELERLNESGG